jgi:hypothetical protein
MLDCKQITYAYGKSAPSSLHQFMSASVFPAIAGKDHARTAGYSKYLDVEVIGCQFPIFCRTGCSSGNNLQMYSTGARFFKVCHLTALSIRNIA